METATSRRRELAPRIYATDASQPFGCSFQPRTRSVAVSTCQTEELFLAHLESNEAAHLNILADLRRRFLDQIANRLLRLSDPRLVHEGDILVVRLDLARDDLLDEVIRLAALLHLLDEDALLLLDLVGRNLVLVDRNRRR